MYILTAKNANSPGNGKVTSLLRYPLLRQKSFVSPSVTNDKNAELIFSSISRSLRVCKKRYLLPAKSTIMSITNFIALWEEKGAPVYFAISLSMTYRNFSSDTKYNFDGSCRLLPCESILSEICPSILRVKSKHLWAMIYGGLQIVFNLNLRTSIKLYAVARQAIFLWWLSIQFCSRFTIFYSYSVNKQ